LTGVVLSLIFWLIDAAVDVLVFDGDESIFESFVAPDPVEFWMRGVVVFLLMVFSFYSKHLLNKQVKLTNELDNYKINLEEIIVERTREVHNKNVSLEAEINERKQTEKKLELLATTDPLTLLYNRRKFDELLRYEIDRDRRYRSNLSLVMCDIDYFKKINDQYGHHIGDKVLIEFVDKISTIIRKTDIFARWGGEEFAILIPGADAKTAVSVAEKIRSAVQATKFTVDFVVTSSFGVSILMPDDDEESLVKRADNALYKAKANGRNCVELIEL